MTIRDLADQLAAELRAQLPVPREECPVNLESYLMERLRYAFGGDPHSELVRETGDFTPAQLQMKRDLLGDKGALAGQVDGTHYKDDPIQHAEFCQRNKLTWCESAATKYLCRHRKKNKVKDVDKAIHYCLILRDIEYPDAPPFAVPTSK